MWIFLNNAYLSIVRHRDSPNKLLVRARRREHIRAVFPHASIIETSGADYAFRATIHEVVVADVVSDTILNIDYDNFKGSIQNKKYYNVCLDVWSTMYRYQFNEINNAKKKKK